MESLETRDHPRGRYGRIAPSLPVAPLVLLWFVLVMTYVATSLTSARGTIIEIVRQLAYIAPFVACTVAAILAYVRSRGDEKRLWLSLSIGTLLLVLSESYVSIRMVLGLDLTSSWPALPAGLSLTAGVALIVLLFRLTDFRTLTRTALGRHLADALGASLVVFGVALAVFLVPLSRRYPGADPTEMLLASAYSVIGLLILVAVVADCASRAWSRWEVWERRVVLALGLYGTATLLWPVWYLGAAMNAASAWELLIEVAWMSSMSLAFAGALTRLRSPHFEPRFRAVPRMRPMRHNAIAVTAPSVFTIAILAFAFLGHTQNDPPLILGTYLAIAVGLTAVVVVRQAASAMENEVLFRTAINDPLTDLLGHRYFHERLQLDLDNAARHGDPVSVVIVDLDDFSRVNNAWGHGRGDEVLKQAAEALRGACRLADAACRIGGDEFAFVLGGSGTEEAMVLCERARQALARIDGPDGRPLTASIGVATFPRDASDRAELVRRADGAVYWAKYHGKNRTVVFDESVVEALSAEERAVKLETESHLSTIRGLAAAVDARDPMTQFHSRNVAMLAVMLGRELELGDTKIRLLEVAALLHDIGMIGISDQVLRKQGSLTRSELRNIRQHPALGEQILSSTQLDEILPWVRHHHERYDGTGYPDGLAGEQIPLEARLIAICDAYDAMTAGRSYHSALSSSAAVQELDLGIGTQFDPAATEAFIRMVGRRKLLRPETRFHRDDNQADAG
ncbi:MAG: diguanylate cyclase [Coriobacteriia bacterium]